MRSAQPPWTGPPCLCGESGSMWGAGHLRASPSPRTADRKGCTLEVVGQTSVARGSAGGGRCGAGRGAGAAGGMWEMRGARSAPRPRLGQPVCKVSRPRDPIKSCPRRLLQSFFPPAASPPDVLSPLPTRLCSYVGGWCVPASKGPRHRRPGLVLTRTPELVLL